MKKQEIFDKIFGKYITKYVEKDIKQIKRELIKENKETQYNNNKDTLIPDLNKDYDLIDQPKPCIFSGYIDLSGIRGGDIIDITVFFYSLDGHPKRYFQKTFNGPLIDPMLTFDDKIVDGFKIVLKQSAGVGGRPINFNWRWKYL